MADVEIKGKISVDAGASAKSINDLNKEIGATKKALREAAIGSQEYKAAQAQLMEQQSRLTQVTANATGEQTKAAGAFNLLKDKLGTMVPALKGAESGAGALNMGFKALAANPIILIVTAFVGVLKFLYDAFTSTREGAQKVEAVFAGVSAAVSVVVDRVFKLGNSIIKFFSGDFKGAAEDAKGAFTGIGEEISESYSVVSDTTKKLQKLRNDELADSVNQSKRKANLAELKAMLGDEEVSSKDKIAIAKKVVQAAKENSIGDIARAKSRLDLEMILLQQKSKLSKEEFQAQFDLQTKLDNAVTVNQRQQIQLQLDALRGKSKLSAEEFEKQFTSQIAFNNVITENNNEIKTSEKALKTAQKQNDVELKQRASDAQARAKEAQEAAKQRRRDLMDYKIKIQKQEQEIELAQLKDGYKKEVRQLDIKLADEKAANRAAREDGKLSKQQEAESNLNIDKLYTIQKAAIDDKYRKQQKQKEVEFREELSKVILETQLTGITDARERERKQLDITYNEKAKQAAKKYADNEAALFQISIAIQLQRRQAEKNLEQKFDIEDRKEAQALSLRKIAFESATAGQDLKRKKELLDQKQAIINQQYNDEITAANGNAQKIADIEQRRLESNYAYSEANKAIAAGEAQAKIQALDSVSSTLDNAANLIGKATLAGKVLAIASATISTFTSAQKAYESTIGIPFVGPFLAPINAGLAIAAGVKNIKSIASVQVPGAGGASVPAAPSVSAPLSPQAIPTRTALDQGSINGIGNAANGGVNRSFVLDADIRNNDERARRISRAARIG